MNRKLISKAIGNIDDVFIAETLSPPAARTDRAPERTTKMGKYETNRSGVRSRRLFSLILAACLVFAFAVTAYAFNLFGIRELFRASRGELPDEADAYIQHHTQIAAAEDWSAQITESLCDGTKVMVSVTVSGGDQYILAPTDAMPGSSTSVIGLDGSQTLEEYAAQQGKKLLFTGAAIENSEALGLVNGSQTYQNISDSEMAILVQAGRTTSAAQADAVCTVYALDADGIQKELALSFTLTEAPATGDGAYIPDDPDAIPGLTVGEATVTETPLGISIHFPETITDQDAWQDIMKVEIEGIEYSEGGSVLEADGNWYFSVTMGQGTLTDTLTVRFYDWEKQPIGTVVFHKE